MAELDELLEERATKEKTLRELQDKEVTLRRDLNDLNRELDLQSTELHILMETVCAKRTAMEKRVREKQKRVEELREEFSVVVRDERRNASYRIIANESRFLKRRISQQKEVRNSLRKQVDEIRDHKKMVKIRCKMMVSEERALWMSISERVKRMAENGHPLDVGHTMVSTSNNQRLCSAGDNDQRSKRFCSSAVLCVSFTRQIVQTRAIRLQVIEVPNGRDQIAFCTLHSFLVEVQTNNGYMHATHA